MIAVSVLVVVAMTPIIIANLSVIPAEIPLLILLLLLALLNYRICGCDVLYPGFIYSVLWLSALAFYTFCFLEVDQISVKTDGILLLGACVFTVGSYAARFMPRVVGVSKRLWKISTSGLGKKLLLAYVLCVFPLFYHDIASLTGSYAVWSLASIRLALIKTMLSGKTPYTSVLTSSLPSIAVMVALVFVLDKETKESRKLALVAVAMAYVIGILTTGRPQIVQLTLGLIVIAVFRSGNKRFIPNVKRLLPAILLLVIVIGGVSAVTKADAQKSGVMPFVSKHLVMYVVGSVPAFDLIVRDPKNFQAMQNATFAKLHPVAASLGWNFRLPHGSFHFVLVPFPMNTYTAYSSYYLDFGIAGVISFCLIIGLLHGWTYELAKRGSQAAMFVYCVYTYQLVMTIFTDQYTKISLFHHAQVLLFMAVYYGVLRYLNFTKESVIAHRAP